MKSILLASSLLLSAALFTPAIAAESSRLFVLNVAPGASPEAVQKALGRPAAMLRPDLWVYLDFTTTNPDAANPDFDTLVVGFTNGRVTAVKLTDGHVVRQLLAQQKAHAAKGAVAAK